MFLEKNDKKRILDDFSNIPKESGQSNIARLCDFRFVFFATFMPGQTTEIKESKVARNTKELVTLLWPEERSCCPRAI